MTEALEKAVSRARSLPPEEQDRLAQLIEEEYEQLEWLKLVERPESPRVLEKLGKQALEEYEAGKTTPMQERR